MRSTRRFTASETHAIEQIDRKRPEAQQERARKQRNLEAAREQINSARNAVTRRRYVVRATFN